MRDSTHSEPKRALAVDPISRGFGFAVLEGPDRLIDWGVVQVRQDKHRGCLKRIAELVKRYGPDVLVTEDVKSTGSRRCARVRRLLEAVGKLAVRMQVSHRAVSRAQVKRFFAPVGGTTKHQIAMVIARRFPELAPRLPRLRKCYMSEDDRMSIFDAVALGLTYYGISPVPSATLPGQRNSQVVHET